MDRHNKCVLVTGTSSGNGKAIALHLDKLGYKVFASVRNKEDAAVIESESSGRLIPIILDILYQDQVDEAYAFIESQLNEEECLYAIVNNAGIIALAPLEITPISDIKDILDLNVVAHIAVTQKFLPLLRKSKGKVINISSVAARVSFPLMGIYSASKAAVNSISDAFRIELAKWDIDVITIEPGAIKTPGWIKAENKFDLLAISKQEIIKKLYASEFKFIKWAFKHQDLIETSSDKVAKQVGRALNSKVRRASYRVGLGARWLVFISKFIALNWGIWTIIKAYKKIKGSNKINSVR